MKLKTVLYCLLTVALLFVLQQDVEVCGEVLMPAMGVEYVCLEAADGDKPTTQYGSPLQMHSSRVSSRLRRQNNDLLPVSSGGAVSDGVTRPFVVAGRCLAAIPVGRCALLALFCVRLI